MEDEIKVIVVNILGVDANIFKRPIQDFMGLMAARGLSETKKIC